MALPRAAQTQQLLTSSAWTRFSAPRLPFALPFHRNTCEGWGWGGFGRRNQHLLNIYCALRTLVGTLNISPYLFLVTILK